MSAANLSAILINSCEYLSGKTYFGILLLMALPIPSLAGTMPRPRLLYREIPIGEALRGMSRNARARQAKQTDLHSTGTYALTTYEGLFCIQGVLP